METTTDRPSLAGRVAPVAVGAALVVAGALVATNDPAAPGSRFPGCTFHQLTGWWCPGCGLTRGTHHLLHADLPAAFGSNVFTPVVLLAIGATWWAWTRRSFGLPVGRIETRVLAVRDGAPRRWSVTLLTVVVAYGVVRNLPIAPFRSLAP